jgi:hypothetical protein
MLFEHLEDSSTVEGYYEEDGNIIFIARGLTKYEAEVVYYHERQHRKCCLTKCRCWSLDDDTYLAECHAYLAEFESVVAKNNYRLSIAYLKSLERCLKKMKKKKGVKLWRVHLRALRRVLRSKAFIAFCEKYQKGSLAKE